MEILQTAILRKRLLALPLALAIAIACAVVGFAQQGSWFAAAPMLQARRGHSMVELPAGPNALGLSPRPGKVMVIGGYDADPIPFPFDPTSNGTPLASCEIYDPVANIWMPAAPNPVATGYRWAAVLSNGMVLVAGGFNDKVALDSGLSALNGSELYDPRTNTWIVTHPLPEGATNPHSFMRAIVLHDGTVLIAGGGDNVTTGGPSRNSFLFTLNKKNPAESTWDYTRARSNNSITRMPAGRTTSALVSLEDGRVLNVGGLGLDFSSHAATDTADIFDPSTGLWTPAAAMPPVYGLGEDETISSYPGALGSRWAPFVAKLSGGRVLIAGGIGGLFETVRASALIYDEHSGMWRIIQPMNSYRFGGFWAVSLRKGRGALFAGPGFSHDTFSFSMAGEVFDPVSETWTLAPDAGGPPSDFSVDSFESHMLSLDNGNIQIAGGTRFFDFTPAIDNSWIFTPGLPAQAHGSGTGPQSRAIAAVLLNKLKNAVSHVP